MSAGVRWKGLPMPDLIAVGYWQSDDSDERFPGPRTLVSKTYSLSVRKAICRYLDSGARFMDSLGYSFCRFQCGVPDSELGSSDLSDGYWVWPQGLSHYVREHHIVLPEEFTQFMANAGWRCPENPVFPGFEPQPDGSQRLPVTFEFWIQWSAPHRRRTDR